MPRRPNRSQARMFAQLIADLEPEIRRAFMASVVDLQANVNWQALLDSLTRQNVAEAIAALNIDPAAWNEYSQVMTAGYAKSGAATAAQIRRSGIGGVGIRFNASNLRAEQWIRDHIGTRITNLSNEQVKAARETILAGYQRGDHPNRIALDLAGRVQGGQRSGGIIGLDGPRAARYNNVNAGMRSPEGVQSLVVRRSDGTLSVRYKVNKSTSERIIRAYRAGTAVPEKQRILSENQYKNALTRERAETIASTEAGEAVMGARQEEWRQLAESQGLTTDDIIKTWQHRRGASEHHRPDHLAMSGTEVRGLNTPFEFADAQMQHAHDPAGGAKHNINCGCDTEYRLDQTAGLS